MILCFVLFSIVAIFKLVAGRPAYHLTGYQPTNSTFFSYVFFSNIFLLFNFIFSCSFFFLLMIFIFKFANVNWLHVGGGVAWCTNSMVAKTVQHYIQIWVTVFKTNGVQFNANALHVFFIWFDFYFYSSMPLDFVCDCGTKWLWLYLHGLDYMPGIYINSSASTAKLPWVQQFKTMKWRKEKQLL